MDRADDKCAVADCGSDTLGGPAADVADCEDIAPSRLRVEGSSVFAAPVPSEGWVVAGLLASDDEPLLVEAYEVG